MSFLTPSRATPSRATPSRAFAAAVAALALAACGGAESKSAGSNAAGAGADPAAGASMAAEDPRTIAESDMVMGQADAPVTVIEYASSTCPHCATFHETIFKELKRDYIDTGKVKFVFREFPTPPVEFALIGSVLPRCAAEKAGDEAYFLLLGSLFKNQRTWIFGDDPKAELLKIAAQAGMDEPAFDACLKRQDLVNLVQANTEAAVEAFKINGTPSFVLNGEKLALRTEDDFRKALDEALGETPAAAPVDEDAADEENDG